MRPRPVGAGFTGLPLNLLADLSGHRRGAGPAYSESKSAEQAGLSNLPASSFVAEVHPDHRVAIRFCASGVLKRVSFVARSATTTGGLVELADWLAHAGYTPVVMGATEVYRKPVWHMLEGRFQMILTTASYIKGCDLDRGSNGSWPIPGELRTRSARQRRLLGPWSSLPAWACERWLARIGQDPRLAARRVRSRGQ